MSTIREFLSQHGVAAAELCSSESPRLPNASRTTVEARGVLRGRWGDEHVLLDVGDATYLIPTEAVTDITPQEASPSVIAPGRIAVRLSLHRDHPVDELRSITSAALAGVGKKPFVLAKPSSAKQHSVRAELVASREREWSRRLGLQGTRRSPVEAAYYPTHESTAWDTNEPTGYSTHSPDGTVETDVATDTKTDYTADTSNDYQPD